MVASPSPDVAKLMSGQVLGVAYQCARVSQGGEAVTGADWSVNCVSADSATFQNRKVRLEVLLGAELGVGDVCDWC